ncbi:MAG: RNA-binding protein [Bacteriovoracaceae bacterium]|nr:RNA-binding protein [Bacteriovoracaceae bacterium]
MSAKIYVGNLSFSTENEGLESLFSQYGKVVSARVITDRETGRSRGFGFIEMSNSDEAAAAIEALNNTEHDGRNLRVNEAEDKPKRSFGGGNGGGGRRY